MIKRLALSLVLMGLAAFSLGAGAVAWFSDSEDANVSITAGSPDVQYVVNQDCDGDWDLGNPTDDWQDGTATLQWSGIVPGDTTEDCIWILNNGDGALHLFVKNSAVTGNLQNWVEFRYANQDSNATYCPWATANDDQYDTGFGCKLDGQVAEDGILKVRVQARFPDNGGNQNGLIEGTLGFTTVLTGYTSDPR